MKDYTVNVTAQAKAMARICGAYVSDLANPRYFELFAEMKNNETLSRLVSLAGEALLKEEKELECSIERQLLAKEADKSVYFDSHRYCLTQSHEMMVTVRKLMGW